MSEHVSYADSVTPIREHVRHAARLIGPAWVDITDLADGARVDVLILVAFSFHIEFYEDSPACWAYVVWWLERKD